VANEEQQVEECVFPLRVAGIDAGSNAMRFLAVEYTRPDSGTVLEQIRTPVRLGHRTFLTGRLDEATMDAAVQAFVQYGRLMRSLGVTRYRAVATSAVRESENGAAFMDRVRAEAGLELEAITGAEEARLVHRAVRARVDLGQGRWLLADLGGGSVELSVVDAHAVHWTVSHDMGSVRLLEELSAAGEDPRLFQRRVEEYTATLRIPARNGGRLSGFIATGGNIETLARLADGAAAGPGVSVLPLEALRQLIRGLGHLSVEQRIGQFGLKPDRADVIVPAAIVYERLCAQAGFDEIVVPKVGVKDGVLADLLDEAVHGREHDTEHDDVVYRGALGIGRRFQFEEQHAVQVTRLAQALFDALAGVYGLTPADRRILTAAGLLHDVGTFIGYRRHHRHSLYLISQTDLPGFTPGEIAVVANVARYHRKSEPAPHHGEFMALPAADRARVTALAALLRIADALDREHTQNVARIDVADDGTATAVTVHGRGDMVLESWAVGQKAGLYERTFRRRLELRLVPAPW
jgi:exopolyphosphatase/guanosine-5'-triphosphate,3'-diphosphate pyrophosphatase